jgi:oligoendopeptidase F
MGSVGARGNELELNLMTAMSHAAVPPRSAIPVDKTWDLESVYASPADWEADFTAVDGRIAEISARSGVIGYSAADLLATLKLRDEIWTKVEQVSVFAHLRYAEDSGNTTNSAMASRASGLAARAQAAAAYIDPAILAIEPSTLQSWVESEPGLQQYRFAFEDLDRMRPHVRSGEVEAVLAQASEIARAPYTTSSTLTDTELPFGTILDSDGTTVQLSQGNVERYLASTDPAVRRSAWTVAADAHLAFSNTLGEILQTGIKADVFYSRAHDFPTALEASLAPTNLPPAVFHNLIETVRRNYPTWHRYFRVRRQLLGVDELHPGDLHAPLGEGAPVISWEEGVELVLKTLEPMGEEYVELNRKGMASRWVDVLPNQGKGSGAFSSGSYTTQPFISMNWHDDLGSVSTLTHELGHSCHSWHVNHSQPVGYSSYSMSSAETASNFHQALMGKYLLDTHDERGWLLAILEERMANHFRYFFIMPILAQFELWAHGEIEAGRALTGDSMTDKLAELFMEGYGGEVVVDEHDRPRLGVTWAQFPHLFMNFYVFQYAVGISAAAALARPILAGDTEARDRYIAFLQEGGSSYPIDQLRRAGIDMSSPEPVQAAFDILAGYVDRLEELAKSA